MEMKTILVALAALGLAGSAVAQTSVIIRKADNSGPVPADASGVQVKASSLPLPSGASTAAKQPALGTAGSPAADVITIQGAASMTAVKVDGSGVVQPISGTMTANIGTTNGLALDASVTGLEVSQGSTTSGQKGTLVLCAVTTSAPTDTTATSAPCSLTTAGAIRVDGSGAIQPASQSGTWNINNVSGTVSLPTGAATSAKQPALGTAGAASADVITIQGVASMTAVKTDGSAVTQPVSGTVTANQGGTWTVQPGNTANTTAWKVDGSAVTQPASIADGSLATLGAKADAKSTATDTTAITGMQVLKEISAMEQAPASRAVTNAGTFATQSAVTAASGAYASGSIADGADVALGAKADAATCATANTLIACARQLHTDMIAATPAGTNAIGAIIPNPVTSTNGSTTVATGNTFQTLLASNAARKGCLIQNPSDAAEILYVSVGIATVSATKAKSYQLPAGASFNCASGSNVVTDNIAVTAVTSAHAFVETDQ